MEGFARQDVAQNRKTPESELRLMGAAHLHLKDEQGYFSVLKRLLESYPSKAYWADAIVRLMNLPGFNNRYELDGYRLLAETENLEEATDYTEMAELALKAGLPAEALRVLENGHQKGVLGKGTDAPAHARLLTEARKKAKEDESLLPQLEQNARDGNAWMAVADAHASKQNWGAAVSAYDKAIKAGGLRREAEAGLHRGIALLKNGQKPAALDQWSALQQDSSAMQLASLWMLLSR
jgi:tetratricopeptide (TPR) repeat protein